MCSVMQRSADLAAAFTCVGAGVGRPPGGAVYNYYLSHTALNSHTHGHLYN